MTEEQGSYTEAQVAAIVASHNLEAWEVFVNSILKELTPSEVSRAVIACALEHLHEAARANFTFAVQAGKALLAAAVYRSAVWSTVLFDVRGAVAEWCVQAGDEEQAQELWRLMLPAEDDMVSLRLLTSILNSALRTRNFAAAETECLRGLALYKALVTRQEASDVVNAFLHAFASLLAARYRFAEASQRFYELYMRTKILTHLRAAIVCAIQSDAGATRARLLSTFYKDKNAVLFGELYGILTRAHHSHLLRPSDLGQFLSYVEPSTDTAVIERAFIQHNLQAISRVYYNIGFAELGALIGTTAREAERLVARMVSERRLDATLDQTTETVVFCRYDNASALEAWDARIASVCEELSHATDLIVSHHNEFSEHLLLN
ncbi:putative cop9 signalosome complex subunit [Trypanosoma rangeli]|uniref:COP9 signalosome complex subunit 4 n=1 Tax=Trypanosoma rangeli TaxID=5698 RepID=A0A422NJX8_TRYRA|nr:putative cop9 signalosome complex subunit [Trypanosoma rangeli]RNF05800.1 putative cop9 signalosome complex subunit [Trypanosoma rangeli]|eukprot:RNF05800.1 putative cop9 signalosome complex subunit [Trypanosoma rangeli]